MGACRLHRGSALCSMTPWFRWGIPVRTLVPYRHGLYGQIWCVCAPEAPLGKVPPASDLSLCVCHTEPAAIPGCAAGG
jgi:hypothetical protein